MDDLTSCLLAWTRFVLSTSCASRIDWFRSPLDGALWDSAAAADEHDAVAGYTPLSVLPFDHERQMVSVLVQDGKGARTLVVKGST